MKKVIVYVLLALAIVGCSSCGKKEERMYLPVDAWDGHNFFLKADGYPVSVIWFHGYHEKPYKGFCQAIEIKEIVERLEFPEMEGPIPELPLKLGTHNSLCLFYYKGGKFVDRVAVVDFDIDEDGVFLGPRGKSPALGKLLLEKEESGLQRYALYGVPGWAPLVTEETIDKAEAANQQLQAQEEQRRKELEAMPFELVNTTIDVFLDPEFDFRGILIRRSDDSDPNHAMVLFGELYRARWIVGRKINPDKIFRYPQVMFSIFEEFKKVERLTQPAVDHYEYDVIFLNPNNRKGYVIKIAVDDKYIYGVNFCSRQLRKDFVEMGLFENI
ncbi:MAG: hypothetical protein ISS71_09705 [Phycisphaerae bacterium]|nr:hypothetical protein [Phycisphaerae bacterium]